MNEKLQLLIIVTAFLIINAVSLLTSEPIHLNAGKGFEDEIYMSIAQMMYGNEEVISDIPYVYRPGSIALALLFEQNNPVNGFFISNLIANFISSILLFYFLRIYVKDFWITFILILVYLTHWLGNTRLNYFITVNVDPWATVFLLSGLILIQSFKVKESGLLLIALTVLSFVSVFFKEMLVLIPMSFVFINNPIKESLSRTVKNLLGIKAKYLLPLAFAVLGLLIIHFVIIDGSEKMVFIRTVLRSVYRKSFFQYSLALFISFGPAIALLIYFYKDVKTFLKENQQYIIILCAAFFITLFTFNNTERSLVFFQPVFLMLIGVVLKKNLGFVLKFPLLVTLIIVQMLTNRIFFANYFPERYSGLDYPFFTVIGYGKYHNMLSTYNHFPFVFTALAEYLALTIVILFVLRFYNLRQYKTMRDC